MKFINKKTKQAVAVLLSAAAVFSLSGCGKTAEVPDAYPINSEVFGLISANEENISANHLMGSDVCIVKDDIELPDVDLSLAEGAGLFDLTSNEALVAKNVHEKLYPASTTKIVTAYVVLKYGNPDDLVTISAENLILENGATHCGLKEGDVISVKDLLYGLMLKSANDAANALADYISGSTEKFAELMNKEAALLGATHSHFVNAHGLHDEEHYTTVYDLYLIFQKALENEMFREITGTTSYMPSYQNANGESVSVTWENTMQYFTGNKIAPDNVTVLAGKTGTTNAALSCLVLLSENAEGKEYISIILKSRDRGVLYEEMNDLLEEINN